MNQELDYAEMLEIPVNTVNVVKKKSIFKRKPAKPVKEVSTDELKERVVESVNERVGAYVYAEDVSDPPLQPEQEVAVKPRKRDKASIVLITEAVAVGVIALAIFLTNIFMPQSAINTFIGMFYETTKQEKSYSDFTLSSVVSDFSDAEVAVTDSGVLYFTAEGSVYPVCGGTVTKVYEADGLYTVEIAHSASFTSVMTGLTNVYGAVGDSVAGNLPVGYSDGGNEVRVSMYDNGTLLNCYTLSGEVPVWVS